MQELSKRLGIKYQSLYERINGNPSLSSLREIADALGVDVSELFSTPNSNSMKIICPHCGKQITIKAEQ